LKNVLLAFVLTTASVFAQTAPATPAPADVKTTAPTPTPAPVPKTVTPKESVSTVKLQLNRSQANSVSTAFQNKIQNDYFQNVKPVIDSLAAQEKDLIDQIKKENGWDDTYSYTEQSSQWQQTKVADKK
jgi:hypothetical protein